MGTVVPFARPLGWVLDLDVRGVYEAQMVGEVLANIPKTMKNRSYRGLALRMRVLERVVVRDDVRRDLAALAERCDSLHSRAFSVTGAALVARYPRDDATLRAIAKADARPTRTRAIGTYVGLDRSALRSGQELCLRNPIHLARVERTSAG